MSNPTPFEDAYDPAARRRAARLRATEALTRIGLKLAAALERELDALAEAPAAADSADAPRPVQDIARAFAQVSRAVSLAVALEDRLDQDPETRRLEAEARAARLRCEAARAEAARAETVAPRRRREIEAAVEQVIDAQPDLKPNRRIDLKFSLHHRLDRELLDLDRFLDRPMGETVARICRGFGLKPDWTRWDAAWAVEAEAAASDPFPVRERTGPVPKKREDGATPAGARSPHAHAPP